MAKNGLITVDHATRVVDIMENFSKFNLKNNAIKHADSGKIPISKGQMA